MFMITYWTLVHNRPVGRPLNKSMLAVAILMFTLATTVKSALPSSESPEAKILLATWCQLYPCPSRVDLLERLKHGVLGSAFRGDPTFGKFDVHSSNVRW
jgi:hypothetical protein